MLKELVEKVEGQKQSSSIREKREMIQPKCYTGKTRKIILIILLPFRSHYLKFKMIVVTHDFYYKYFDRYDQKKFHFC